MVTQTFESHPREDARSEPGKYPQSLVYWHTEDGFQFVVEGIVIMVELFCYRSYSILPPPVASHQGR
jgi:hypothetical protein